MVPELWHTMSKVSRNKSPYFSVLQSDVVVPDGTHRDYTVSFTGPAVGVIARRGTDILLMRQYRFIVNEFVCALPSWSLSEGEQRAEAARTGTGGRNRLQAEIHSTAHALLRLLRLQ